MLDNRQVINHQSQQSPPAGSEIEGRIACSIIREYGDQQHRIKKLARITGASQRTVEGWIYEGRMPQTVNLIALMADSDEVFAEVCALAGRKVDAPLRNNNRLSLPHLPDHLAEAVNGLIDAMARDDRPVNQNMAPVRAGEQWDLFK